MILPVAPSLKFNRNRPSSVPTLSVFAYPGSPMPICRGTKFSPYEIVRGLFYVPGQVPRLSKRKKNVY